MTHPKLSPGELAKFLAANTHLSLIQLSQLNSASVDLDGFTTAQIAEYKTGLDEMAKHPEMAATPARPINQPVLNTPPFGSKRSASR